jgi:hypothetical protein
MPPFCFSCVAQFVSTKDAFSLPTHMVWQAASFTKVAGDPFLPLILNIYTTGCATSVPHQQSRVKTACGVLQFSKGRDMPGSS